MTRIVAAILIAVCIASAAQAGGVLRRGNYQEPASLDPQKTSTVYDNAIAVDMFEGLVAPTPGGGVEPAVAQSWSVSADGKTWTFILRAGLQWSDGAPITADDVVFSFRRLLDPKTAAEMASVAYVFTNAHAVNSGALAVDQLGVTAPKPNTVVITLEHPAPYLPQLLTSGALSIVPHAVIEKFGDDWVRPEHIVSNGAFMLKEWVPNGTLTLVRNPHFRAPPVLDEVIFEPTEDLDAAVTRFRAGSLDMQFQFPSIQLDALRREMPAETKAVPSPLTYYLPLNMHRPKLADVRVRRALSLAIDRDLIAARVLRGGQIATATYVPNGFWGYQAPELPWEQGTMAERLERAKGLLREVGISPEKPLRLVYSYSNNTERKRVGVALAAMWKPLGVQLVLAATEGKVMFSNLAAGDFDMAFVGWTADYPDPTSFLNAVLSTSIAGNYSRYDNHAYDVAVARAQQVVDPTERMAQLRDAERIMLADQPIIPLFVGNNPELVSTHVHGWAPNPRAVHPSRFMSVDPAP